MATLVQTAPGLSLSLASGNAVNADALTGTITANIDQGTGTNSVKSKSIVLNADGRMTFGLGAAIDFNSAGVLNFPTLITNIMQTGALLSNTLGNLSFASGATVNFAGATVTNLAISGNVTGDVRQTGSANSHTNTMGDLSFLTGAAINLNSGTISGGTIGANTNVSSGTSVFNGITTLGTMALNGPFSISGASFDISGATSIIGIPVVDPVTSSISQAAGKTAVLNATSWNAASAVNFANATISNFSLLGANGNSVDNAALPTTISKTISNSSSVTTATLTTTTMNLGPSAYPVLCVANRYTIAASNSSSVIGYLSGLNLTTSTTWVAEVIVIGSSNVEYVKTEFVISKGSTVTTAPKVLTITQQVTTATKLGSTTAAIDSANNRITFSQPSVTTSDGAAYYRIYVKYHQLVGTSTATLT
jgi:hypothetical protein